MWPATRSRAAMLQGRRVLDAGCGTGYGSAELAQSAAEVTGVDIAADAIEYASANYPIPGLQFIESSCTAVPFPPASFDLVVAFEVIEHLTDYRVVSRRMRASANPRRPVHRFVAEQALLRQDSSGDRSQSLPRA